MCLMRLAPCGDPSPFWLASRKLSVITFLYTYYRNIDEALLFMFLRNLPNGTHQRIFVLPTSCHHLECSWFLYSHHIVDSASRGHHSCLWPVSRCTKTRRHEVSVNRLNDVLQLLTSGNFLQYRQHRSGPVLFRDIRGTV